ncbi:uncharacterized protein LOC121878842 [Homarus americanus]|uniref:uncharacterized protein LOC121878842 n=1 Tax=Homarus americanus TaxID=6706 RepID=UPI001C44845B|nr:uncharacterized protein LOC121878842 [Homarus americanus]
MATMKTTLIFCLFLCHSVPSSRGHRSRRGLQGSGDDHHDHAHDHAKASASEIVAAIDARGSRSSPSSGNPPPNSWLYKFPPWFLPSNPAPEGFKVSQGKSQDGGPEFSMVDDGDILIIDDIGSSEHTSDLSNIRVPGNSAFQDEVVQTLLGVKYGTSQDPSSLGSKIVSDELVTPWLVPQSVPEPPLPNPAPTVPLSFQNHHGGNTGFDNHLVTTRPQGDKIGLSNNENIFVSKTVIPESTPTNFPDTEFHPSPPDLTFTARPFNDAAQVEHASGDTRGFRPSPLISVTHLKANSVPGEPVVTSQGQQQHNPVHNNIQHNSISGNIFKGQLAALLKASDRPHTRGNQNQGNNNHIRNPQTLPNKQEDLSWTPFIPGIPLAILQQLSQAGRRGPPPQQNHQGNQQPFNNNNNLRLQHHNTRGGSVPDSASLPTSIQDIIDGAYDTVQPIYRKGRQQDSTAVNSGDGTVHAGGGDQDNKWLWRSS